MIFEFVSDRVEPGSWEWRVAFNREVDKDEKPFYLMRWKAGDFTFQDFSWTAIPHPKQNRNALQSLARRMGEEFTDDL